MQANYRAFIKTLSFNLQKQSALSYTLFPFINKDKAITDMGTITICKQSPTNPVLTCAQAA